MLIVIWAGLAFLPYAFYVLAAANFVTALATGLLSLAVTLGAVVGFDAFFYGKLTVCWLVSFKRPKFLEQRVCSLEQRLLIGGWCTGY
jgi:hypothetical protein